jgi:hypothetical protein
VRDRGLLLDTEVERDVREQIDPRGALFRQLLAAAARSRLPLLGQLALGRLALFLGLSRFRSASARFVAAAWSSASTWLLMPVSWS